VKHRKGAQDAERWGSLAAGACCGTAPPARPSTPSGGLRARADARDRPREDRVKDRERLKGKNILTTGAARGMGATNAGHFAAQGANVCLGDLDGDAAQEMADRINAPRPTDRRPAPAAATGGRARKSAEHIGNP